MRLRLRDLQRVVKQAINEKKLIEAGIAQPKAITEPFDIHGDEPMGDASKTFAGPELSDRWYSDKASKFIQDYGTNIEGGWEHTIVKRYCSSVRATTGVDIDEQKLLGAIMDLNKEREDRALERDELKETLVWLRSREETIVEHLMPEFVATVDPVSDLLESTDKSPQEYIERANEVFGIREATLQRALGKHRMGESNGRDETVPVNGVLPHDGAFRNVDEAALDRYIECWNSRQVMQGEPLQLSWCVHPDAVNKVSFSCILK